MAPRLWMLTTYSSSNIYPLHFQKAKGREIIISEYPRFHLTWKYSQIFIKPLPKYMLSFTFWDNLLVSARSPLESHDREELLQAATGLLRTYYYLVQYESDFRVAQSTGLLPQDITWHGFSNFIAEAQFIHDRDVAPRYHYGEIRLTRLNFYSKLFLHRSQYEWGRPQYSDYFNRFYGHILFVFAMLSLLLSAMQVELASESLVADVWMPTWYIFRYVSVVCIFVLALTALSILVTLIAMISNEWVYAIRSMKRKRVTPDASLE
ncbi:hypothetical protein Asppvi_010411 [Aspergillus pseudoviridinutans]|uniref:Subtilisin-like serine protease n=1 Tax=Aspergillus pseudoviridinutans TaxID=1517512 RepID=A0A9P3BPJ8_9EURO|nr:uncharacterized protein Asppvi_010411 [Aspergillus pseudoviridinutans]GIJ91446.1 hypothetical protein Asppvi_010411 [Aspergillus pseudoviridinutans]